MTQTEAKNFITLAEARALALSNLNHRQQASNQFTNISETDLRRELNRMALKAFAHIPNSPTKGIDRVRITSHFNQAEVYVARLVKSSGRWSTRRYLVDKSTIRYALP